MRSLPGFLRFLPVAALFHGQVINISGLARDAATARTTVEGYIDILQDTLLATILPGFEARLRVRERQHPKLYWVDSGVVRAAKRQLGAVGAEERGALLEGWMLTVLRAHNAASELESKCGRSTTFWKASPAERCGIDPGERRVGGVGRPRPTYTHPAAASRAPRHPRHPEPDPIVPRLWQNAPSTTPRRSPARWRHSTPPAGYTARTRATGT